MRYPSTLIAPSFRVRAPDALERWSYRLGWEAREALRHTDKLRALVSSPCDLAEACDRFFGIGGPSHAFRAEPLRWLRLTETQVTRGLSKFLNADAKRRVPAFLKALHPHVAWPADLSEMLSEAEVPTKRGRIDLLITGRSGGRIWGAVIEAKFEHGLKRNPLPDYLQAARGRGLDTATAGGPGATCSLVIVGRSTSRSVAGRLVRNSRWSFRHWDALLRRFEAELRGHPDDEEFRRFRRTVWERAA